MHVREKCKVNLNSKWHLNCSFSRDFFQKIRHNCRKAINRSSRSKKLSDAKKITVFIVCQIQKLLSAKCKVQSIKTPRENVLCTHIQSPQSSSLKQDLASVTFQKLLKVYQPVRPMPWCVNKTKHAKCSVHQSKLSCHYPLKKLRQAKKKKDLSIFTGSSVEHGPC